MEEWVHGKGTYGTPINVPVLTLLGRNRIPDDFALLSSFHARVSAMAGLRRPLDRGEYTGLANITTWLIGCAQALAVISHLHAHGNADDPEVRREFAEITEVIEKERQIEKPWKNLIEPRTSSLPSSSSAPPMIGRGLTIT